MPKEFRSLSLMVFPLLFVLALALPGPVRAQPAASGTAANAPAHAPLARPGTPANRSAAAPNPFLRNAAPPSVGATPTAPVVPVVPVEPPVVDPVKLNGKRLGVVNGKSVYRDGEAYYFDNTDKPLSARERAAALAAVSGADAPAPNGSPEAAPGAPGTPPAPSAAKPPAVPAATKPAAVKPTPPRK
jgi:hypothetical protein